MRSISLKLREELAKEAESLSTDLKISRNQYINEAVALYNKQKKRELLKNQLAEESTKVQKDSMVVLEEFEQLEEDV